jgi:hypothetical protein
MTNVGQRLLAAAKQAAGVVHRGTNGFPQSLAILADVAHLGAVSAKYLHHHLVRALEAKIRSQREKLID